MLHPHVLFIGDRPTKKNVDPRVAFVGTDSYRTLLGWIAAMDLFIDRVDLTNAYSIDGEEILHHRYNNLILNGVKIVCLGKKAEQAYKEFALRRFCSLDFFSLPHPSRLNRKLNDKQAMNKLLAECKEFIYGRAFRIEGEK